MKVPFLDLQSHHAPLRDALLEAIRAVIDRNAFAGGPFVARFEEQFAAYCGTRHAVGVGSGTEALWLTLLALGIGPGDEVITVPSTFMATAEAITYAGATPVFVDINEETYTLDPELLERAMTRRTAAIIPVHLFGHVADMDPILELAAMHELPVIEDACQAHGATYKGRRAGSLGTAGCFSFYPGKNLGAFGEAGAITTDDPALADRLRIFRDHGQDRKYHHSMIGWNARMDGIQAAVLEVKLKQLDRSNQLRCQHAVRYHERLRELEDVILPFPASYAEPVYHVYAVRVPERDRVLRELAEREIHCGIHYPVPVHLQQAYRHLELGPESFPVAERCADEFLSLPMYPELTDDQIDAVANALAEVVQPGRTQPGVAIGDGERGLRI
jgi:dTDP-4-amino-4,6-dideoxygalactose transaminase